MSEALKTINASARKSHGSQSAKQLRRKGMIPAIVYGHKEAVISISIAADDMRKVIRQGSRIIDVAIDGKPEKCLVQEVQWDVFGKDFYHVDFKRISADEKVHITVPIQLRGTAKGQAEGGVINMQLHDLHVECLATNIPDTIRINIAELGLDQAIHIRELALPEGVKVLGDPDEVVVTCAKPMAEEEKPAEAVEGAVEPEVISTRKPAEEEEE